MLRSLPIYTEHKYLNVEFSKSYSYKDVVQFMLECMQSLKLIKNSFTRPPSCYAVLYSGDLVYHVNCHDTSFHLILKSL